jgi:hypothetical protein
LEFFFWNEWVSRPRWDYELVFKLRGVHHWQNIIHALLVSAAGAAIIHELMDRQKNSESYKIANLNKFKLLI